jgi:hypothetical protein
VELLSLIVVELHTQLLLVSPSFRVIQALPSLATLVLSGSLSESSLDIIFCAKGGRFGGKRKALNRRGEPPEGG